MVYVEGCAAPHQTSTSYRYLKYQLSIPQVITNRELICYLTRRTLHNPRIFAFFSNSKTVYKDQFVTLGDLLDSYRDPFVLLYEKAKYGFSTSGLPDHAIPSVELFEYISLTNASEVSDFIRLMNRSQDDVKTLRATLKRAPSREAIRAWIIASPGRTYYQDPTNELSPENMTNFIIRIEGLSFQQYDVT